MLLSLPWVLEAPLPLVVSASQRSSHIGLLSINISCLFSPGGVLRGPPWKYLALWSQLHAVGGEWVWSRRQDVQAGSNVVKVWDH